MSEADPTHTEESRERVPGGNEPPAPRVAPEAEGLDRSALELAAHYAGAHAARALLVLRRGHIVFERYWHGTGFETLTDSQSLARVVAALTTLRAISERRIGWLDQPVGQLMPELKDEARGAHTVRSLLGLAGRGADFTLLAQVLERVAGDRYSQFLSRVLWRRIGAADASLELEGAAPRIGCCMRVAQGDWIRVAELLLQDGKYRGEEVLRPGFTLQLRRPAPPETGAASFVPLDDAPPPSGEAPAARDMTLLAARGGHRMWLMPSLQLAIVRLGSAPAASAGWDEGRIPNTIARGLRDRPASTGDRDISSIVPHH